MDLLLHSNEAGSTGLVYSFVPAHRESKASAVSRTLSRTLAEGHDLSVLLADFYARGFPLWGTTEAPQRLNRNTWGAFLRREESFDTLEAREAHPSDIGQVLDHGRRRYHVVCADLTEAKQVTALEVLRHSDSIFLVTASDAASLEIARFKAAWLRSLGLEENSGLLLCRTPDGAGASAAEEATGLPVCALVDCREDLDRLAAWLSSSHDTCCPQAQPA